jgi:ankyrin repeat protein
MTALHQAVLDNNLTVVKILCRHGSMINLKDADSWTALHAACANGHADIAR